MAIEGNPRRLGKQLRFELEGLWVARRGPFGIIYEIDETSRVVTVATTRPGRRARRSTTSATVRPPGAA